MSRCCNVVSAKQWALYLLRVRMPKIGSLCTGYGGLDMAVEEYFDAETVWVSEIDKYANQLIELKIKKPNLGDLKLVDWANVEPIDILTAGYPCQPFSHAGQRQGTNDARHIWPYIKTAISVLRPRIVILENVRGHLSLGFSTVLGDLAEIGYDAQWTLVRASDVGAPHRRERLFVIATPQYSDSNGIGQSLVRNISGEVRHQRKSQLVVGQLEQEIVTDTNSNAFTQSRRAIGELSAKGSGFQRQENQRKAWSEHGGGSQIISDSSGERQPSIGNLQGLRRRFTPRCEMHLQDIPNALDQGKLNAQFVEYMMGLPPGWVTDCGLSRAQQLKILGNGVVPQQAHYAL
ncbi:MAG: DNA (cytosine-5-)-methyltransferase, partial [Caulobacteraceae bacterium]|nr:DNA (cytosine-5-)-methyltransferase [Caulobacteraceae bacterium]